MNIGSSEKRSVIIHSSFSSSPARDFINIQMALTVDSALNYRTRRRLPVLRNDRLLTVLRKANGAKRTDASLQH